MIDPLKIPSSPPFLREINSGTNKDFEAMSDVRYLQERVDRLSLACGALWNLLKSRTKLTDEDLFAAMAKLDLQDGVADGKVKRASTKCGKCGKMNSRRRMYCIYCAEALPTQPFD